MCVSFLYYTLVLRYYGSAPSCRLGIGLLPMTSHSVTQAVRNSPYLEHGFLRKKGSWATRLGKAYDDSSGFWLMGYLSSSSTCHWSSPKKLKQKGYSAYGRGKIVIRNDNISHHNIYRILSSVLKFEFFTEKYLNSSICFNFTWYLVNPSSIKIQYLSGRKVSL